VLPALAHIWPVPFSPLRPALALLAIVTAVMHIYLYDYYKEVFLHMTDPGREPLREDVERVAEALARHREQGASFSVLFALNTHVGLMANQRRFARLTNPASLAFDDLPTSPEAARIYRRYGYWPMQLWALISLCPHSYLLALSGIFQRLELYLWFRAVVANVLFAVLLLWQRWASTRALQEISRLDQRDVAGGVQTTPSAAHR
jgi:hypothetical protein